MQTAAIWEYKGTTMRSSRIEDKDAYYINGFTECDREIARMTGSKMHYSKEEVDAYFVSCLSDTTRYDFLLFDSQDSLIGECVINEIDEQARSA
ncbi:N-acetyltransferase, partial [Erysipelatoclostridium ramosum]|nr:N-acetyltransferase [Thomasclavelia ramosa]